MGAIKMRYYVTRNCRSGIMGYWQPTKAMRAVGFSQVACGPHGPGAWALAEEWNRRWDSSQNHGRGTAVAYTLDWGCL